MGQLAMVIRLKIRKDSNMSLVSILNKIESKILELEDKKEEIQQQIRDMSALETPQTLSLIHI